MNSKAGQQGVFITLEGGEGVGKSTLAKGLAAHFTKAGREVLLTREPGGTPLAEELRDVILKGEAKKAGPFAEAMLFSAARIDHIDKLIRPSLNAGRIVICDRFADSTRAYQGALGRMDRGLLTALERVTLNGIKPDLTLMLDLPAEEGLARAKARRGEGETDRFEAERIGFHRRLRQAFLDIAASEPERCVVINAALAPGEVLAMALSACAAHDLVGAGAGAGMNGLPETGS
ncbi:MAG: dTMP kinase [Bosea sp. (in: a-proteobacteria)]